MIHSNDTEVDASVLAEELRATHDTARRKEAWKRVAEEAIRILGRKYQPVIEAMENVAQEEHTP